MLKNPFKLVGAFLCGLKFLIVQYRPEDHLKEKFFAQ
jgi:hypothetical protein